MDRRRFNTLPRRADDEWQGGVVRLPSWVERGPGGRPYRPWAGFWISRNTGFVHLKVEPAPDAHGWTLALETLLEFAAQRHLAGYRPGRLQVCDGDLGARLIEAIGDPELGLTVLSDLPAVRQALSTMAERLAGGPLPPDALDADGVTVDRMRAFARAADAFYRAAPWRYLLDEDLIHVEAPSMKHGLRHVTILGAAGPTVGLGFFDSAADHAEVQEQDDPRTSLDGRGGPSSMDRSRSSRTATQTFGKTTPSPPPETRRTRSRSNLIRGDRCAVRTRPRCRTWRASYARSPAATRTRSTEDAGRAT